jgi:thymidine kinase
MDVRFGVSKIKSRAGLECNADLLVKSDTKLCFENFIGLSCILVDEAQFLSANLIEQLREITRKLDIPVICFGLRTDFRSHLFEGSKRLIELSDSIEEIKVTCHYCERKAILNLKHVNGKPVLDGPSIQLGTEELYFPVCYKCYQEAFEKVPSIEKVETVL